MIDTSMRSILSVATALAFSMPAIAAEVTVIDGQTWCYDVRNGTATIGAPSENKLGVPRDSSGHLVVPASLGGCPVTQISQSAFYGCSNITEITIPKSVTDIGRSAFAYCGGLRAIVADPENKKYAACDGILLDKAMKNLIFCPSAVKRVVIPDSVMAIEDSAFESCRLTELSIPDSVETIGEWAFHNCKQLESVILPRQLKKISAWTFAGCSVLTSVQIPEGVVDIGDYAFQDCSGLSFVSIPSSVRQIGVDAFSGCGSLSGFDVNEGNKRYASKAGLLCTADGIALICCPGGQGDVKIPDGVREIGRRAFWECSHLTNLTVPASVIRIRSEAFDGCKFLASVRFLGRPPTGVQALFLGGKSVTIEYDARFKKEWKPFLSHHKAVGFNSANPEQGCSCELLSKVSVGWALLVVVVLAMVVAFFVKRARAANACHRQKLGVQQEDVHDANQSEGKSSEGKASESVDNMDEVILAIEEDGVMTVNEPKTEAQREKTFRRAPSSVQTIAVVLVLEAAVWLVTAPSIGGVVSLVVRFLIARAAVRGSAGAKIVLYVFGLLGLLVGILIMALSTSKADDALAKMFFYGGGFNLLMGVLLSTRSARKWTK